eukprot:3547561-Amphidinium_carterae.1
MCTKWSNQKDCVRQYASGAKWSIGISWATVMASDDRKLLMINVIPHDVLRKMLSRFGIPSITE